MNADILSLLGVGILAGLLSGFFGLGGGAVLVPLLVFLVALPQHAAQGISMLVIVPTALISAWYFHKNKFINYNAALFLAIGAVTGAVISSNLAHHIPPEILRKLFGVFAIIIGLRMFFSPKKAKPKNIEHTKEQG